MLGGKREREREKHYAWQHSDTAFTVVLNCELSRTDGQRLAGQKELVSVTLSFLSLSLSPTHSLDALFAEPRQVRLISYRI